METDCIIPDKKIEYNGYTYTTYEGETRGTHRIEWIKANGIIPKGYVVDHICHDPKVCNAGLKCPHRACINLEHLRLITQQENILAGLHNIDNRSMCNQGHSFEGNIMVRSNGKRECAECNRVRARRVWANRKVRN